MLTLKDARGIVFLTNEYDAAGRISRQTQADGTTYQFTYTLDQNGKIIQTDVTDPRGKQAQGRVRSKNEEPAGKVRPTEEPGGNRSL